MTLNEWMLNFETELSEALDKFAEKKVTPELRSDMTKTITPIVEKWLQLLRGVKDDS